MTSRVKTRHLEKSPGTSAVVCRQDPAPHNRNSDYSRWFLRAFLSTAESKVRNDVSDLLKKLQLVRIGFLRICLSTQSVQMLLFLMVTWDSTARGATGQKGSPQYEYEYAYEYE